MRCALVCGSARRARLDRSALIGPANQQARQVPRAGIKHRHNVTMDGSFDGLPPRAANARRLKAERDAAVCALPYPPCRRSPTPTREQIRAFKALIGAFAAWAHHVNMPTDYLDKGWIIYEYTYGKVDYSAWNPRFTYRTTYVGTNGRLYTTPSRCDRGGPGIMGDGTISRLSMQIQKLSSGT